MPTFVLYSQRVTVILFNYSSLLNFLVSEARPGNREQLLWRRERAEGGLALQPAEARQAGRGHQQDLSQHLQAGAEVDRGGDEDRLQPGE